MSETPARGARSRALRRRRRRRTGALLVAVVLTGVAGYVGLRVAEPDQTSPSAAPRPSPTPLDSLDLSGLPVARRPMCGRIDESDVSTALGGPVASTDHYGSGQRAALAPGLRDVSHEFDCTYRGPAGASARVWVFAEPLTVRVASGIARDARTQPGCRPIGGGPTFGTPSVTTVCRPTASRGRVVALRGLFGDAWLTCQLTAAPGAPPADTVRRSERWCVRVVTKVGAGP